MAANKIDSIQFVTLVGAFTPPQKQPDIVTPPGKDGDVFRRQGLRGVPSPFVSIRDYDSAANMDTAKEAYSAYVGQKVTVIDALGVTYNNVLVLSCRIVKAMAIGAAAGGVDATASNFLLIAEWVMIQTENT